MFLTLEKRTQIKVLNLKKKYLVTSINKFEKYLNALHKCIFYLLQNVWLYH